MSIEPGLNLLHYRIVEKLGEGGMGVVWKAVDTSLDREVAIKVLPETLAADGDHLARFEREAKLLASLNHPNIAAVYGLHTVGEDRFLAMELIPGEDIAERQARGPVPIDDALAMARQIADALQAAHDSGVIHRDLKPANIMLTAEGTVKVLDFGLAKAAESSSGRSDPSMSPTLTSAGTRVGVILGTAAYMSPEQAKGGAVDRRTDLWAFGVILYEMLTGQRLFAGDSISEVLASVLMTEPDLDRLPTNTPPRIRRLIERCLRRDAGSRLRDAGDARIVIEEALAGHEWTAGAVESRASAAGSTSRGKWLALGAVAGLLAGVVLTLALRGSGGATTGGVSHVAVPLGPTERVPPHLSLAPDGRTLVYPLVDVGPESDHLTRLYVRRLDEPRAVEIPRSTGVLVHALSPDGRWVAFLAPESERAPRFVLLKVPLDLSAPPLKLTDWPGYADGRRIIWPEAGTILSSRQEDGALLRFPAAGGPHAEPVLLRGDVKIVDFAVRAWLPGARHVLAQAASFASGAYRQDVLLVDVETGDFRVLVDDGSWPRYARSGHVVFSRGGSLLAVPFDRRRLEVTGGAQSVMDGLWAEGPWTGGPFALSTGGDLLFAGGAVQDTHDRIVWVTRQGEVTPWIETPSAYNSVRISPDGERLAVQIDNIVEGDALLQIRVSDVERPRLFTVGALPGMDCQHAVWSTDSEHLAFLCLAQDHEQVFVTTGREGSVPELVAEVAKPGDYDLAGFAAGDTHVMAARGSADGSAALVALPVRGGEPVVVAMEETRWREGSLSPDGRYFVYVAEEAGRDVVYVRELRGATAVGPRRLVSADGARAVWFGTRRPNGGYELLITRRDRLYVVEVTGSGAAMRLSEPRDAGLDTFALGMEYLESAPDGRFLMVQTPDTRHGAARLGLVLGWEHELRRRMAGG